MITRRNFIKQLAIGTGTLLALPVMKLIKPKPWTFNMGKYDSTTEILYLNGKPAMIILDGREYSDSEISKAYHTARKAFDLPPLCDCWPMEGK